MPIDNDLYNRLSESWWDDEAVFALLRLLLNPARFGYFYEVLEGRLELDPHTKAALDVGCGGGLLAEEFARRGWDVTGVDPSAPSITAARAHALEAGLPIGYLVGVGEELPVADASYELVYCCDVLEHVNDLSRVISEIARVLKPGGIFCYDTINRTLASRLSLIMVLQKWPLTRILPANLHEWRLFIKPHELTALLEEHGLKSQEICGLQPSSSPLAILPTLLRYKYGRLGITELARRIRFQKSRDTSISYIGYARK